MLYITQINYAKSHIDEDGPQDPSQTVISTGTTDLQFLVCR